MTYKINIHDLSECSMPKFERIKSPKRQGKRVQRLSEKQVKLLARRKRRKVARV